MKTIFRLAWNDLRRDAKRPWSTLAFTALPLLLSVLIASIFGGHGGSGPMPTVHIALLDQDKDLLTGMLRSLPAQGSAAKRLRIDFVDTQEAGLRLVEKGKVSALVVLPPHLTANLLHGETNAIALYENPAEQILPKVVREGVSLLALGLSEAADVIGEPLRDFRELVRSNSFPLPTQVGTLASNSVHQLRGLRTYLFPPLVQFETIEAADFDPQALSAPAAPPAHE